MKLEGQSNYIIWRYKVQMLLLQESLWKYVEPDLEQAGGSNPSSCGNSCATRGATPSGSQYPSGGSTPNATIAAAAATESEKIRACRILISMVKDSLLLHVIHLTNPLKVWQKLKKMYDLQTPSRRLALKEKLYSLRLSEGQSIDIFLQNVNSTVTQLARLGITINDEDLVDQVLVALPKSWSVFKSIYKSRTPLPSFAELEGLLLHEDSTRRIEQDRKEADVLLSRSQPQYRRGRRPNRGGKSRGRSSNQDWKNKVQC